MGLKSSILLVSFVLSGPSLPCISILLRIAVSGILMIRLNTAGNPRIHTGILRSLQKRRRFFAQIREENKELMKNISSRKSIRSPRGRSTISPQILEMTVTLTRMTGPAKTVQSM